MVRVLLTNVVEAAVSNRDDQSPVSGPKIGDELSAAARLRLVLRAFAAAPLGADTPQLLISQAVAATGSSGGVVCGVRANRVVILASEDHTPDLQPAYGPLVMGGLSLPLTHAATTEQLQRIGRASDIDGPARPLGPRSVPGRNRG